MSNLLEHQAHYKRLQNDIEAAFKKNHLDKAEALIKEQHKVLDDIYLIRKQERHE